jgi:lactoylglutathione lyase
VAKAIHSMIRVLDEVRSVRFCERAFGLHVADRFDSETFTLVCLRNAEAGFELGPTVNKGRAEPYDLGDGYGHIAFVMDDVDAGRARLTAAGLARRKLTSRRRARPWPASSSSPTRTATGSRC